MEFARSILTETDMSHALADRRNDLDLRQEEVEHDVGLAHGHLGKIEAGAKSWGKRPFRINDPVSTTPTLMWLMEAYQLKLLLVDENTARQILPVDKQETRQRHRSKETGAEHPNQQRMTISVRRRQSYELGTCGGYSPASINSDSLSSPSMQQCETQKPTDSPETQSLKPSTAQPTTGICNICGYPSVRISSTLSMRPSPST